MTAPDPGRSAPPATRRHTPALRVVLTAVATIGVVVLATWAYGTDRSGRFEELFPADYVGPVWLTLAPDEARTYEVELRWGRLSTEFTHTGPGDATYYFDRGTAIYGRDGPLQVEVSPRVDVTFGFGPAPPGGIDLGARPWTVEPERRVGANRPATQDRPVASAVVNEYVTYGLVVEGVGVHTAPSRDAERVTNVRHGQRLDARCWSEGQQVTNSNLQDPSDDAAAYTSRVWYLVETTEGEGFLPDVWFARDGDTGRLNLPPCDG